jgi:flagellar hook-associated protein 3 FlgL
MVAITRTSASHEIARHARLSSAIADGQERIASGTRLKRASDAPADWSAAQRMTQAMNQAEAWNFAIGSAQGRAAQADTALASMDNHLVRARELMVQANGPSGAGTGRDAIIAELSSIRDALAASLNQTDSDGVALFSAGSPLLVPAGTGLALPAAGSRASIEAVQTSSGPQLLDGILANAIAAVAAGGPALAIASDAVTDAGQHLAIERGRQGQRTQALEQAKGDIADRMIDLRSQISRLKDTDLSAEIIDVQQRMTALDAARASFARLGQKTLFDLIG